MSKLWKLSALEMAEHVRTGQTSSRELLEAHLERIDEVNPHLNAVVRRLDEQALAAADAADVAVAAGGQLGPLHGVPCTVKENIDVAGTPTTQAVTALAEAIAPIDAPTTARMRAAGAIPFARTNLPDFGLRVHTDSQLHGLTRNPWNPDVTAGGSSGGEASAIASGMSPIGLGNDIGGSLRNPAHCCGIASLKPTVGVIPMATSVPPEDNMIAAQLMVVEGPMARTVADVRVGLDVLAGPDIRDPRTVPAILTDAADGERLRIAVLADPPGGSTDAGIAGAIVGVADRLADAGHEVVEVTPPDYELAIDIWCRLLMADLRAQADLLAMVMGDGGRQVVANLDARVADTDFPLMLTLHAERNQVMRSWSAFFADHPVLLCPTWAHRAFRHDEDLDPDNFDHILETMRPVVIANLLGSPAAITPAGVVDGLPVGAQVMGDRFTDLRCLTVAAEIESLVGTVTPIDPIT